MTLNHLISIKRKVMKNKKIIIDLSGCFYFSLQELNIVSFGMLWKKNFNGSAVFKKVKIGI